MVFSLQKKEKLQAPRPPVLTPSIFGLKDAVAKDVHDSQHLKAPILETTNFKHC